MISKFNATIYNMHIRTAKGAVNSKAAGMYSSIVSQAKILTNGANPTVCIESDSLYDILLTIYVTYFHAEHTIVTIVVVTFADFP
jgi:hypothetical protein